MRAYTRRRLVATRSTLLPRATVATLSHGISYLLVDSFVSYLVELVFTSASLQYTQQSLRLCQITIMFHERTSFIRERLCTLVMWRRLRPPTFHSNPLVTGFNPHREVDWLNAHSIRFGTFTFLVRTRSMWIECAFNAHWVPSADASMNRKYQHESCIPPWIVNTNINAL